MPSYLINNISTLLKPYGLAAPELTQPVSVKDLKTYLKSIVSLKIDNQERLARRDRKIQDTPVLARMRPSDATSLFPIDIKEYVSTEFNDISFAAVSALSYYNHIFYDLVRRGLCSSIDVYKKFMGWSELNIKRRGATFDTAFFTEGKNIFGFKTDRSDFDVKGAMKKFSLGLEHEEFKDIDNTYKWYRYDDSIKVLNVSESTPLEIDLKDYVSDVFTWGRAGSAGLGKWPESKTTKTFSPVGNYTKNAIPLIMSSEALWETYNTMSRIKTSYKVIIKDELGKNRLTWLGPLDLYLTGAYLYYKYRDPYKKWRYNELDKKGKAYLNMILTHFRTVRDKIGASIDYRNMDHHPEQLEMEDIERASFGPVSEDDSELVTMYIDKEKNAIMEYRLGNEIIRYDMHKGTHSGVRSTGPVNSGFAIYKEKQTELLAKDKIDNALTSELVSIFGDDTVQMFNAYITALAHIYFRSMVGVGIKYDSFGLQLSGCDFLRRSTVNRRDFQAVYAYPIRSIMAVFQRKPWNNDSPMLFGWYEESMKAIVTTLHRAFYKPYLILDEVQRIETKYLEMFSSDFRFSTIIMRHTRMQILEKPLLFPDYIKQFHPTLVSKYIDSVMTYAKIFYVNHVVPVLDYIDLEEYHWKHWAKEYICEQLAAANSSLVADYRHYLRTFEYKWKYVPKIKFVVDTKVFLNLVGKYNDFKDNMTTYKFDLRIFGMYSSYLEKYQLLIRLGYSRQQAASYLSLKLHGPKWYRSFKFGDLWIPIQTNSYYDIFVRKCIAYYIEHRLINPDKLLSTTMARQLTLHIYRTVTQLFEVPEVLHW